MKRSIFLTSLICLHLAVLGQVSNPIYDVIAGSQLNDTSELLVTDPIFSAAMGNCSSSWNDAFIDKQAYGLLSLRIDHEAQADQDKAYEYTFTLDVKYHDGSCSGEQSRSVSLTVVNDPSSSGKAFKDRAAFRIPRAYWLKATVTSIKDENGTVVNDPFDNLRLSAEIYLDRRYPLAANKVSIDSCSVSAVSTSKELEISWHSVAYAKAYELEWTYVDDYKDSDPSPSYYAAADLEYDFRFNSTRIRTADISYRIPDLFEHGYVLYRVRPIGWGGEGLAYEAQGAWTPSQPAQGADISAWPSQLKSVIGTAHEQDEKNWQLKVSYAEDGKSKAVASYFDGSSKNRQSVTVLSTEKAAVVGESIYDPTGRPIAQVLPAPTDTQAIKYYRGHNLNGSNKPLDYSTIGGADTCPAPEVSPLSENNGAARYYSSSSPWKNSTSKPWQKAVPDADGYPYTATEYMPDPTGRVKRQSGVGSDHRLGSGHETTYDYGEPTQAEVDRLFGNNGGKALHYKKNVVVDPNGQVTLSYLDQHGRVIGTALGGESPANVASLSGDSARRTVLLSNTGYIVPGAKALRLSYPLFVEKTSEYRFTYRFKPEQYENSCLPAGLCLDCAYSLEISIVDECGEQLLGTELDSAIGGLGIKACATPGTFTLTHWKAGQADSVLSLVLEGKKTYYINKVLRISEASADLQAQSYLDTLSCLPTLTELVDSIYTSLSDFCDSTNEIPNTSIACQVLYQSMIQDVSPHGQYGILWEDTLYPGSADDQLSLYRSFDGSFLGNWLPDSFASYLNPIGGKYYNGQGDEAYVYDKSAGEYVAPQELDQDEFVASFQPSWAQSLVGYHPEYPYYEWCRNLDSSNLYKLQLQNVETFAAAKKQGLLDFTHPWKGDPIFRGGDSAFLADAADRAAFRLELDTLQDTLLAKYSNYFQHIEGGDTLRFSLQKMAAVSVQCEGQGEACVRYAQFDDARLSQAELDRQWRAFRALYFGLRDRMVSDMIRDIVRDHEGRDNGCIGDTTRPCSYPSKDGYTRVYRYKTKRFPDVGQGTGLDFAADGSVNIDSATQWVKDSLQEFNNTVCESYIPRWRELLRGCKLSAANEDDVINGMLAICKGSQDTVNPQNSPMGYWEAPGISNTEKTFAEVLAKYVPNYDAICNPSLLEATLYQLRVSKVRQPLVSECGCGELQKHYKDFSDNACLPAKGLQPEAQELLDLLNEIIDDGSGLDRSIGNINTSSVTSSYPESELSGYFENSAGVHAYTASYISDDLAINIIFGTDTINVLVSGLDTFNKSSTDRFSNPVEHSLSSENGFSATYTHSGGTSTIGIFSDRYIFERGFIRPLDNVEAFAGYLKGAKGIDDTEAHLEKMILACSRLYGGGCQWVPNRSARMLANKKALEYALLISEIHGTNRSWIKLDKSDTNCNGSLPRRNWLHKFTSYDPLKPRHRKHDNFWWDGGQDDYNAVTNPKSKKIYGFKVGSRCADRDTVVHCWVGLHATSSSEIDTFITHFGGDLSNATSLAVIGGDASMSTSQVFSGNGVFLLASKGSHTIRLEILSDCFGAPDDCRFEQAIEKCQTTDGVEVCLDCKKTGVAKALQKTLNILIDESKFYQSSTVDLYSSPPYLFTTDGVGALNDAYYPGHITNFLKLYWHPWVSTDSSYMIAYLGHYDPTTSKDEARVAIRLEASGAYDFTQVDRIYGVTQNWDTILSTVAAGKDPEALYGLFTCTAEINGVATTLEGSLYGLKLNNCVSSTKPSGGSPSFTRVRMKKELTQDCGDCVGCASLLGAFHGFTHTHGYMRWNQPNFQLMAAHYLNQRFGNNYSYVEYFEQLRSCGLLSRLRLPEEYCSFYATLDPKNNKAQEVMDTVVARLEGWRQRRGIYFDYGLTKDSLDQIELCFRYGDNSISAHLLMDSLAENLVDGILDQANSLLDQHSHSASKRLNEDFRIRVEESSRTTQCYGNLTKVAKMLPGSLVVRKTISSHWRGESRTLEEWQLSMDGLTKGAELLFVDSFYKSIEGCPLSELHTKVTRLDSVIQTDTQTVCYTDTASASNCETCGRVKAVTLSYLASAGSGALGSEQQQELQASLRADLNIETEVYSRYNSCEDCTGLEVFVCNELSSDGLGLGDFIRSLSDSGWLFSTTTFNPIDSGISFKGINQYSASLIGDTLMQAQMSDGASVLGFSLSLSSSTFGSIDSIGRLDCIKPNPERQGNNHGFMIYGLMGAEQNRVPLFGYTQDWVMNSCCKVEKTSLCPGSQQEPAISLNLTCQQERWRQARLNAYVVKQQQDDKERSRFLADYYTQCQAAFPTEALQMTYSGLAYHNTLYYYDQAGNLVQTVPPKGVDTLHGASLDSVKSYRSGASASFIQPRHRLATTYRYNSLNEVLTQQTPDGGLSKFFYDRLGRLVASQNARQLQETGVYSYTLYDKLGRVHEAGELDALSPLIQSQLIVDSTGSHWDAFMSNAQRSQIVSTLYDKPSDFSATFGPVTGGGALDCDRLRAALDDFLDTYGEVDFWNTAYLQSSFNSYLGMTGSYSFYNDLLKEQGLTDDVINFHTSGYVDFGTPGHVSFDTSRFSVEAWYKANKSSGEKTILSNLNRESSKLRGFSFYIEAGKVYLLVGDGHGNSTRAIRRSDKVFDDYTWYHVVAVRIGNNGDNWKLYVNGQLEPWDPNYNVNGLVSGNIDSLQVAPLTVGGRNGTATNLGNRYFNGAIKDVRLYSRGLSLAEAQQLYNNGCGDTALSGCIFNAPLKEASGTTVTEISSYALTGTLTHLSSQRRPGARKSGCGNCTLGSQSHGESSQQIAKELFGPAGQENLVNRVAAVYYYEQEASDYQYATHYSYDVHGNVKTVVHDMPELAALGQRFKKVEYDYDLVSGNVNQVAYQKGEPDQWLHHYEYDADNRITSVQTSRDGLLWDKDATYRYYLHGPLARVGLGDNKVQGVDYAYTLHGWLKGVNSNSLNPAKDLGQDGHEGSLWSNYAQDAFGFTLGYYRGDYKAIDNSIAFEATLPSSGFAPSTQDLYNGNISHMVTALKPFMAEVDFNGPGGTSGPILRPGPLGLQYGHDQLNRLVSVTAFENLNVKTNAWTTDGALSDYLANYTYDAMGNITSLTRHGNQGTQKMDDLTYHYYAGTNRLSGVEDAIHDTMFSPDKSGIADIDPGQNITSNYEYDAIGNLIGDAQEEIDTIIWNVQGKVREIRRTAGSDKPDLEFRYGPDGQRLVKIVKSSPLPMDWQYTLYRRDAQGNVLATEQLRNYLVSDSSSLDTLTGWLQAQKSTDSLKGFVQDRYSANNNYLQGYIQRLIWGSHEGTIYDQYRLCQLINYDSLLVKTALKEYEQADSAIYNKLVRTLADSLRGRVVDALYASDGSGNNLIESLLEADPDDDFLTCLDQADLELAYNSIYLPPAPMTKQGLIDTLLHFHNNYSSIAPNLASLSGDSIKKAAKQCIPLWQLKQAMDKPNPGFSASNILNGLADYGMLKAWKGFLNTYSDSSEAKGAITENTNKVALLNLIADSNSADILGQFYDACPTCLKGTLGALDGYTITAYLSDIETYFGAQTRTQALNDLAPSLTYHQELAMDEYYLYGSSRLGSKHDTMKLLETEFKAGGIDSLGGLIRDTIFYETIASLDTVNYSRTLGYKRFELSNHLGNVMATVLDRRVYDTLLVSGSDTQIVWQADVANAQDYYPGGMLMPGRIYTNPNLTDTAALRHGFGGHEQDDEVKGKGGHIRFEDYGYDPRLIRRWNTDPMERKYPGLSPYAYSFNNPILFTDPDGNDGRVTVDQNAKTMTIQTTIHLYGAQASQEMADALNDQLSNMKTERKIEAKNGETWIVKLDVTYVYNNTMSEMGKIHDDNYNLSLSEEQRSQAGFEEGDNALLVDTEQAKSIAAKEGLNASGATHQGSDWGFAQAPTIAKGISTIFHESWHQFGFDERYLRIGLPNAHQGFGGDVMGNDGKRNNINDVHFVDYLDYVMDHPDYDQNQAVQEFYLERPHVDNTNYGAIQEPSSKVNEKKNRVKN